MQSIVSWAKELIDTAEREHLVLYQADIFQVPRLISLLAFSLP